MLQFVTTVELAYFCIGMFNEEMKRVALSNLAEHLAFGSSNGIGNLFPFLQEGFRFLLLLVHSTHQLHGLLMALQPGLQLNEFCGGTILQF